MKFDENFVRPKTFKGPFTTLDCPVNWKRQNKLIYTLTSLGPAAVNIQEYGKPVEEI